MKALLFLLFIPVISFSKPKLPLDQSVKIATVSSVERKNLANEKIFTSLFMKGYSPPPYVKSGTGSGVVVSSTGDIITNYHVINGATDIKVISNSGIHYSAKIISADGSIDLALIRAPEMGGVMPVVIGDSNSLSVGDGVFVIASPFGMRNSYSKGYLSAKNRQMGVTENEDSLQIDASVNPGASGGGVYSKNGELVGIASGIITSSKGFQGISIVIPSYIIDAFIKSTLAYGTSLHTNYGIHLKEWLSASTCGVKIVNIEEGSYASSLGFLKGDIILSINSYKICKSSEASMRTLLFSSTTPLSFFIKRGSKRLELKSNPTTAVLWSKPWSPKDEGSNTLQ